MNPYKLEPALHDATAVADPAVERAFFTRVYGWMALALGITGLVATATISNPTLTAWIFDTPLIIIGIAAVQLITVLVLTAAVNRLSTGVATGLFILYAALTGLTFSTLFYVFTAESIGLAFFITAGVFALFSLYGFITKTDLTSWGNLAFMGVIGMLIASLVNLFLRNETIYWITTYVGVLAFVGLIAYNTQRIKRMAYGLGDDGELRSKAAVVGGLSLYLSFINLFFLLLRIFGKRR